MTFNFKKILSQFISFICYFILNTLVLQKNKENQYLLMSSTFTSFKIIVLFFLCFVFNANTLSSQNAIIYGNIIDNKNKAIELVNVAVLNTSLGTSTDVKGNYRLVVPAGTKLKIIFSRVGYQTQDIEIELESGQSRRINIEMAQRESNLPAITVVATQSNREGMQRMDPRIVVSIPSPSGNFEQMLKLLGMGVSGGSELSSAYSVRGGNFDENLVYVNDVEIYRPFLVRSGQQEGLSFINSELVSSVLFSSGGFDASYGDKSASVLDVQYKRPTKFASTVSASLLGSNAHVEGISLDSNLRYLFGVRYKSSQYVLNSLEVKGDYKPSFFDYQSYITYDLTKKTELAWLSYGSQNTYRLIPETRETSYGTINEAYRLTIHFSGQEVDKFSLFKNALLLTHKPNDKLQLKFILSGFVSQEQETFDILGQYWLGRLETDFGKPGFGEVAENRGVGGFLNHARNYLSASVVNLEHKGKYFSNVANISWGIKAQYEYIQDKIDEWTFLDSSSFSLPKPKDSVGYINPSLQAYQNLYLSDTLFSEVSLKSMRYSGFVMANRTYIIDSNIVNVNVGLRANYWDMNSQFLLIPRATLSLNPKRTSNVLYRLAGGLYYQPPFYRELRNLDGSINTNIQAQKSTHLIAGVDIDMNIWNRPFKFSSELYYKHLDNLIPYIIDNVRIKYLPEFKSKGYVRGIDFKINGEFVPGIESWANLSIMQTEEDIIGDRKVIYLNSDGEQIFAGYTFNNIVTDSLVTFPGFIARPTDQRVNFSLFFQDYFPNNPTFKMHLGLYFGTGVPFGPPTKDKYKHVFRMPPYRRVDVGFSKQFISEGGNRVKWLNFVNNAWVSVEVFNLLQISNTISYVWIQDVTGRQYAVPNYLTSRQINFKVNANF